MSTYLRSVIRAKPGSRVPWHPSGHVLHLNTAASITPLCGTAAEGFALTGSWAAEWPRHAHWPLCTRCARALQRLTDEAATLTPRRIVPPPTESEPIGPDCAQGKHGACSGTAWDETADDLTVCACCAAGHERTES